MSKTKAGPIAADRLKPGRVASAVSDRLEGFVQRILALQARQAKIAEEILELETAAGVRHMWTYIIRAGEDGPVKIGKTGDVMGRLASLQTAQPDRLKIIRLIRGDGESALHHHFAKNRIRGEWFRFDPTMLTIRVTGCINFRGAL